MGAEQSIFRESAMKRYLEGREKNVLLRLVSPPVFKFLWILLPLLIGAVVLTWSVQVPVLITGQGVVIDQIMTTGKTSQAMAAGGTSQTMNTGTAQVVTTGGTAHTTNTGKTKQATNIGKTKQTTNNGKTGQQGTNNGKTKQGTNNGKIKQGTNNGNIKQGTNNGNIKQGTNNGNIGQTTNTGNIQLASINANIEQPTDTGKTEQAGAEVVALLFLPPDQRANLHVGESVNVNVGSGMGNFTGTIESVEAGVMSPSDIRARYNLQGVLAQAIGGPSAVVTVRIGPDSSMHTYVGSLCNANVQIGSQSVLAMMPGFDQVSQVLDGQFFQTLYEQIHQFLK